MSAAHSRPTICYVTDRKTLNSPGAIPNLVGKIQAAAAAGADWVQIREKDLTARELLDLARAAIAIAQDGARASAASFFSRILINDRLDVALAASAAGVHLGHNSAPVRETLRWLRAGNAPTDFLVGVSCHSMDQVREAEDAGASYLFFGPVFDTPSKRPFGPPHGIAQLEKVCRSAKIPVLAIGGVNEQNAGECIRAGASGIAAIRLFQDEQAAGALKETISRLHELA